MNNLENYNVFKTSLSGREFTVETGKLAGLANGSCLIRFGDTVVLVTATASNKPRDGIDFFPLSVDFDEKLYAVGRIPGSFLRRESRPSERAILASRQIDRPMRSLFSSDIRNDVSIVATVMSVDNDNSPEIAAMIGASIAVCISDIPFDYPMAGVSVGLVNGEIIINPTVEQRGVSDLDLTVAATMDKIVMIEAGANEVPEHITINAIKQAHTAIKEIIEFINKIIDKVGKPKFSYPAAPDYTDIYEKVAAFAEKDMEHCLDTDDKNVRDERKCDLENRLREHLGDEFYTENASAIDECMYKLQKSVVRRWLKQGKRVDGRGMTDIRALSAEVGLLPRVHGSGLFTRGQTQALSVATLSVLSDAQEIDTIFPETSKRYLHHYNFPSFSVGETRPGRGPGRREIGHGALAERSIIPVLPSIQDFPYAIRVVSEVLSSNGSTSQASVCGSTLALMDAGVPIKAPVAGISCGLIVDDEGIETTFTDIQGLEDFFGDMDFKVAGTKNGITSIQVDIKTKGLSYQVIEDAFEKCKIARNYILDEVMTKAISEPRKELSEFALKMVSITINPEKIRDVIGKGGAVIQKLTAETNTKIDISEDGTICIASTNIEDCERAKTFIKNLTLEPKVGERYHGKVVRLMNFGAFVEIAPGKDGLVHISKLSDKRVEKVEDAVKVGDMVWVKLLEIDDKGRINLSIKDIILEDKVEE